MNIKNQIPNAITCANLFSGCVGIVFAFENNYKMAFYMAVLAALFDFLDGTAARILKANSAIGKELDSLADVVSFGVLPSIVLYFYLNKALNLPLPYFAYLAFFIAIFSAIRLAKFNVDTQQSENFIGLNVPTNALMLLSIVFVENIYPNLTSNFWLLGAVIALSCYLLISKLKLFSLKINNNGWRKNQFKLIFVFISLVLIAMLNFVAIPIIVLFYIIFSYIHFKYSP